MQVDKTQVLNRVATIQGHLHGIRIMIEADVACADILRQTYAVAQALNAFDRALLECHMRSALKADRRDEIIRELRALLALPGEDHSIPQVDARLGVEP